MTTTAIEPFTLREFPDLELCKTIWRHPDVRDEERGRLKAYCDKALKEGFVDVEYTKNFEYARHYPRGGDCVTACSQQGQVRSTLFHQTELDIDIVNCHPVLTKRILNAYYPAMEFECLDRYIADRQSVIDEFEGLPKNEVKMFFCIIMYGGTVKTWRRECEISDDYTLPQVAHDFIEEYVMAAKLVLKIKQFKPIIEAYWKYKKTLQQKELGDKFDEEKFELNDGSKMSAILQTQENDIIQERMSILREQGVTITSYNYDGFQVLKETWDDEYLEQINMEDVKFIVKPFAEPLDMDKIVDEESFDIDKFERLETYDAKKMYFEMFHFKLMNPPCFVVLDGDEKPQLLKVQIFKSIYENLLFKKIEKTKKGEVEKVVSFVGAWARDPKMRTYNRMEFAPPPISVGPKVYNVWKGFPIEKVTLDTSADTPMIYKHRDYVTNHYKEAHEYVLNWFAHMVQKPGEKPMTALLIGGEERSGKSVIGEHLMRKIIGLNRQIITPDINKLCGRFATSEGKILTTLNEGSGRDTHSIDNLIKDYITREYSLVEPKGLMAYTVRLIDRVVVTTNSKNPLPIKKGDSRWVVLATDNSICSNREHFDPLYRDLKDDRVMRKFYQELLDRDISNWNPVADRPISEMAKDMMLVNSDCYTLFASYMRTHHPNEIYSGEKLYDNFRGWWHNDGRKLDLCPTGTKFGVEIKNRQGVVTKRTDKGMSYKFTLVE